MFPEHLSGREQLLESKEEEGSHWFLEKQSVWKFSSFFATTPGIFQPAYVFHMDKKRKMTFIMTLLRTDSYPCTYAARNSKMGQRKLYRRSLRRLEVVLIQSGSQEDGFCWLSAGPAPVLEIHFELPGKMDWRQLMPYAPYALVAGFPHEQKGLELHGCNAWGEMSPAIVGL